MQRGSDKMSGKNSPLERIEQIRDLIFGPQMDEYGEKFKQLEKEILVMRKDLKSLGADLQQSIDTLRETGRRDLNETRNQLSATEKALQGALTTTEKSLRKLIDSLQENGVDRLSLAEELIELGQRMQGNAQEDNDVTRQLPVNGTAD